MVKIKDAELKILEYFIKATGRAGLPKTRIEVEVSGFGKEKYDGKNELQAITRFILSSTAKLLFETSTSHQVFHQFLAKPQLIRVPVYGEIFENKVVKLGRLVDYGDSKKAKHGTLTELIEHKIAVLPLYDPDARFLDIQLNYEGEIKGSGLGIYGGKDSKKQDANLQKYKMFMEGVHDYKAAINNAVAYFVKLSEELSAF